MYADQLPFITHSLTFQTKTRRASSRAFTTTTTRSIATTSTVDTSTSPLNPARVEKDVSKPQESTSRKAPQTNIKMFQTYTAYGMTELLYKECALQADYSIPQAQDEDFEIPKAEDGEDLGVGGGWWHDGTLLALL
jgi:cytochrome b pre-mRNA-processing protein 3